MIAKIRKIWSKIDHDRDLIGDHDALDLALVLEIYNMVLENNLNLKWILNSVVSNVFNVVLRLQTSFLQPFCSR